MNSCAVTDKGIVRRQNQDSYSVFTDNENKIAIVMVCDGMGGAKAGNVASDLACKVFANEVKSRLSKDCSFDEMELIMKDALCMANAAVYELSVADENCRGMGTTLVAAAAADKKLCIMNVGDSRAYIINKNGIGQITRDHSVVEDMIERGKITREESKNHPNKHLITRAVGTSPNVVSDIFKLNAEEGDVILLCSDGLSNVVSDKRMLEELKKSTDITAQSEGLVKEAIVNGAPDNVTVVLFEI